MIGSLEGKLELGDERRFHFSQDESLIFYDAFSFTFQNELFAYKFHRVELSIQNAFN